jgi:MraZ protein
MFIGEYNHTLDEKGRLAIPAKFRLMLKSGAVVTRGIDQCLFLYPKKQWLELAEKITKMPISQSKARAFSRLILAGGMDVEFDQQGRINLPEYLRHYAGLKKKTVIAGLFNRLEIWDDDKWQNYKKTAEQNSNTIAETLGEIGI